MLSITGERTTTQAQLEGGAPTALLMHIGVANHSLPTVRAWRILIAFRHKPHINIRICLCYLKPCWGAVQLAHDGPGYFHHWLTADLKGLGQ